MARTRAFDEDMALDRALRVFWSEGYKATSMERLLTATGLSKSSLYETFGSKRQLLIQCLRLYARVLQQGPFAPLVRDDAGRPAIEAVFATMIDRAMCPENGQAGCFVNNCVAEIAPHDPLILRETRRMLGGIEDRLTIAVERGQADGSIRSREAPRVLATFLLNTLSGINLAAKARPPRERLEQIVRVALRCLDQP